MQAVILFLLFLFGAQQNSYLRFAPLPAGDVDVCGPAPGLGQPGNRPPVGGLSASGRRGQRRGPANSLAVRRLVVGIVTRHLSHGRLAATLLQG